MNTKATIGTVSHATMLPEDLIPTFASLLEELHANTHHNTLHGADARTVGLIRECEQWQAVLETEDTDSETDSELLDALFDALEDYAPDYCYFGAHEGDGSDYGFWPSWDAIEDGVGAGEILKIDAGDEWPELAEDVTHVLEVTDHGNAALYTRDHTECWACV